MDWEFGLIAPLAFRDGDRPPSAGSMDASNRLHFDGSN